MKLSEIYQDADIVVRHKVEGVQAVLLAFLIAVCAAFIKNLVIFNAPLLIAELPIIAILVAGWFLLRRRRYRTTIAIILGTGNLAILAFSLLSAKPPEAAVYEVFVYYLLIPVVALVVGDRPVYPAVSAIIAAVALSLLVVFKVAPAAREAGVSIGEAIVISSIFFFISSVFSITSSRMESRALHSMDDSVRLLQGNIAKAATVASSSSSQKVATAAVRGLYEATRTENAEIEERVRTSREATAALDGDMGAILETVRESAALARDFSNLVDDQNAVAVESSAAVHQMAASLDSVSKLTVQKKDASDRLLGVAETGRASVDALGKAFQTTVKDIGALLNVIQVVGDIADRTNLLSMNAAIEAAHAGDSGKGFAVVAGEIRTLAESSAVNAQSIERDLKRIMEAVRSTDNHVRSVDSSMTEIVSEIVRVSDAFREILNSVEELAAGGRDIDRAMRELSDTSVKVRDGARRIEAGQEGAEVRIAAARESSAKLAVDAARIQEASATVMRSMERLEGLIARADQEAESVRRAVEELAEARS
ncbi:MAG: hypothetical protein JXA15_04815 [Spirochaetales bacterium]|nr:hypothetical protein [Spirochaetales bacterium]